MLHYALHCIASLPSSASDTPVPPLGLFYLRSTAVVAGLELQVLVPSGPAAGPAAASCSYGSLASQPIPLIPIQQDPCPRTNFLCIGPRLAPYFQVQACSDTPRATMDLTLPGRAQHEGLRCDTIILQHKAEQEHTKEAKLQGDPPAASWETRKCDQGPCMRPITRGFPAISLSMIPSSGDRRSSVPRPTSSKGPGGAWGAKGSHQIPTAACNEHDRQTDRRQTRSRLSCLLRYFYDVGGHTRHSPILLPVRRSSRTRKSRLLHAACAYLMKTTGSKPPCVVY